MTADPKPSPTTQLLEKTTTGASGASSDARNPKKSPKSVHFVLQAKGGVGKSLTASLVAQYLTETGKTPVCFDTDPLNESLVRVKALGAHGVQVLREDALNGDEVDRLIERILTADTDVVVDNGAASFVPMSRYLMESNIAALIDGAGKRMVVHSILVGGGNTLDTIKGLEALLDQFPSSVKVVVWLNDFFGPVAEDDTPFEDTGLYRDNVDRIIGSVHLKRQNPLFAANIGQMLSRKLTFAEALADPEFMTVPKQRLTMFRRSIWEQLAPVI